MTTKSTNKTEVMPRDIDTCDAIFLGNSYPLDLKAKDIECCKFEQEFNADCVTQFKKELETRKAQAEQDAALAKMREIEDLKQIDKIYDEATKKVKLQGKLPDPATLSSHQKFEVLEKLFNEINANYTLAEKAVGKHSYITFLNKDILALSSEANLQSAQQKVRTLENTVNQLNNELSQLESYKNNWQYGRQRIPGCFSEPLDPQTGHNPCWKPELNTERRKKIWQAIKNSPGSSLPSDLSDDASEIFATCQVSPWPDHSGCAQYIRNEVADRRTKASRVEEVRGQLGKLTSALIKSRAELDKYSNEHKVQELGAVLEAIRTSKEEAKTHHTDMETAVSTFVRSSDAVKTLNGHIDEAKMLVGDKVNLVGENDKNEDEQLTEV